MKKQSSNFKKKSLFFLALCVGVVATNAQNFQWVRSLGGSMSDEGRAIAVDASGNVYTTGVFQGVGDFDPGTTTFTLTALGNKDVYVSKLDAAGNFLWAKQIGGTSAYVESHGIKVDASGNVFFVGEFQGVVDFDPGTAVFNLNGVNNDAFIAKFDASGNLVWSKDIGSSNVESARGLALDAVGNVFFTGSFSGTVDFDPSAATFNLVAPGSNKQDVFVTKFDGAGNFVWAKNMGGTSDDIGYAIAIDANNNVYTTGSFSATADFDPGASVVSFTAAASTDMFISKLDPLGNYIWAKQFTCAAGKGIAVDGNFNVYTTSAFASTVDFDPGPGTYTLATGVTLDADIFVSKLDVSGNFVWAKQMGGLNTNPDDALAITLDASNNVYTTGLFSGTGDFDPGPASYTLTAAGGTNNDVFVSKLDANGSFVWAVKMGGTASVDQGTSIVVDPVGFVYTTGIYVSGGDFDPSAGTYTLLAAGGTDAFVHKMGTTLTTNLSEINSSTSTLIFPNPNNGAFTIKTNQFGLYTISNSLGQVIKTITITDENTEIDVSTITSGMYYLAGRNWKTKMYILN